MHHRNAFHIQWCFGSMIRIYRLNQRNIPCFQIRTKSRQTYATVARDEPVERHVVSCGSSGSIDIDLYNSSALSVPTNPLIIYLPPSGNHLRTTHPSIPPFLFSKIGALASINYRWNIPPLKRTASGLLTSHPAYAVHPFPTPIHDTLHAYSYLTEKFLPTFAPISSLQHGRGTTQRQRTPRRPILIYGSYLGGTIATSLALTESYGSKSRQSVTGLISKNTIYDWTEVATTKTPLDLHNDIPFEDLIRQGGSWDSRTLQALKTSLFKKPESCFDHFASPTLFFFSAGVIPPPRWLTDDFIEEDPKILYAMQNLTISEPIIEPPSSDNVSSCTLQTSTSPGKTVSELDVQTTRAAHLKFPPRDSGLKIPRALILSSSPSPTKSKYKSKPPIKSAMGLETNPRAQAEEMARLMRRSIVVNEMKDRMMVDNDVDPHAVSEERVQVGECDGNSDEETRVREWIEDCLEEG